MAATVAVALAIVFPEPAASTLWFVLSGFVSVAPLVIPGMLLSAWVAASGVGGHLSDKFSRNRTAAVVTASAIGAVTPVCGVTVLPLMTGLLGAGVPLAPVMAFWLSSPVTDPAMIAATAALLGIEMAVAKTLAAFLIGLFGGAVVAVLARRRWVAAPLRPGVSTCAGGACEAAPDVVWAIWRDPARRRHFLVDLRSMTGLILLCLTPAFAAEHLLAQFLAPDALAAYVGADSRWAVPLAVFVGAPAYLDGYAALPLTRSLMDHGMSPGAALAFLVSGGVVSIWGAMAIAPVLRLRPFLLYLALAVAGSLAAGYLYDLIV
ncbi:MAG: permease [Thalassobaculaceae bacterium]|nr:permease [Thalassobaculaceae bacterium]